MRRTVEGPVGSGPQLVGPALDGCGFEATARRVLDYLNDRMPMGAWVVSRVENERQTFLYVDTNDFGLHSGASMPWQDTYCARMVDGSGPRIAPVVAEVPAYVAAPASATVQIGAYAGAPITDADGSLFGTICGVDHDERPDLTDLAATLTLLSDLLTVALRTDRALQAARETARMAHTVAVTDALTGIANRAAWDARIAEIERARSRYADPTVIVIVDLDDLKLVNDGRGGHIAGDQLLRRAAAVMQRTIRDHDFVARLGGDEFGIVFARTPAAQAPVLAERLGHALGQARVQASIGWAAVSPGAAIAQSIDHADRAMYAAKARRKQVHTDQPLLAASIIA